MHVTCVYSHGGDVFTREGIGGVTYQQTGLTHSPEGEGQRNMFTIQFNIMHNIMLLPFCMTQALAYFHVA